MRSRGGYFILYKKSKTTPVLAIKFPSLESTPFITIGGKRASRCFEFMRHLFKEYQLIVSYHKLDNLEVIEVPWATGLASVVFLLSAYSSRKPLGYASLLERLISGKMPLSGYLLTMPDLAQALSEYMDSLAKEQQDRRQILRTEAAIAVSRMLNNLLKAIEETQTKRGQL